MKTRSTPGISGLFLSFFAPLCLLFGANAHAVTANEAPPAYFTEDSFGASISSEYFSTKANYEPSRGAYTRLPGDSNLTDFETKLRGRYTISKKVSTFLGTSYRSVHATDLVNSKTNSQFSEALAGVDYLVNFKSMQLVPELILSVPIDQTNPNQVTPMTNDGVSYVKAGLFVIKPYHRFRLGGFGGVQYPADSLAKRFVYEATIDWKLFTQFTIGAGVDGYESILGDTQLLIDRQAAAVRANAGSERFYSFTPALVEARSWIGWRPNRALWLRAGFAKTLNGVHTAEGQSFLLSIVYNSGRFELTHESPATAKKKKFDPDEAAKSFEVDVESTDQSVFQPDDVEVENTTRGNNLDSVEKNLEKKSKDK